MFNFAIPGIMGEGLRMAWEAGADHVPVRIEQAAAIEGVDDLPASVGNVMSQPNLLVNLQGTNHERGSDAEINFLQMLYPTRKTELEFRSLILHCQILHEKWSG